MNIVRAALCASRWRLRCMLSGTALLLVLAACGGGGGGSGDSSNEAPQSVPSSRVEAQRFLTHTTFGPTEADIDRVMALGYSGWIDEQIAKPQALHRDYWDADNAALKAVDPNDSADQRQVLDSFYIHAIRGEDQLRQRVAFALSQIFVISMMNDSIAGETRGAAGYLDMLAQNAFGNYRTLLESVAKHPMMGLYLSHLRNQKENPSTGRVPDENFAREVMQLFSIGLYKLNDDGSVQKDSNGRNLETYTGDDISGLAKVFTGWSWYGPDASDSRFYGYIEAPDRNWMPMQAYSKFHSTSEKRFLGTVVAAQASADAAASLKTALDTLANHPNVGPFIGKQLIQRLVTSNPSAAYVGRVAEAFNNNGSGVRGDLKAVVKAVLLDPEARDASKVTDTSWGKLREPVLRLTAFLRAFGATSDSGKFLIDSTDDPSSSLGQTPLRSPSVFNFYRPGYVPPNTQASALGLAVPEMQITHETSVGGYANYMRTGVQNGFGRNGVNYNASRRDVQLNYASELALADKPAELVDHVTSKLMGAQANTDLKAEIQAAVESVTIPALRSDGSNQTSVNNAKRNRVYIAVVLSLVSPEFLVQK